MPASFWIFLIICIASFVVAVDDHGSEWNDFKESTGGKKWWKGLKIFTLWFVCVGSFLGTLVLGHESKQSDTQYEAVTNQLARVTAEYDQATNSLVEATNDVAMFEKQQEKRQVTPAIKEKFIKFLSAVPRGRVEVEFSFGAGNEISSYANQIRTMIGSAGYDVGFMCGMRSGVVPNGITIGVKNPTNQPPFAGAIQKAFNAVGIPADGIDAKNDKSLKEDTLLILVGDKS